MGVRSSHRAVKPASRDATVRFLLRLPSALHRQLVADAAAEALSLNEYCVQRLGGPDLRVAGRQQVAAALAAASAVGGAHLLGVIAHGSWVRGEARDSSDVDVMIVVDPSMPLTRDLYRAWDTAAPTWDGRAVDGHFVHPPAPGARPSSVWCELAVEGVLLSDRAGVVSAALTDVRRAIAHGRLVRKTAHGQPYWTEAA
jgi:hypothetical protein